MYKVNAIRHQAGDGEKNPQTGSGKTGYATDVSVGEWACCGPYLSLMTEDAPQRKHGLREVFSGGRYMVRAGCPWHMIPGDFPPVSIVYQQVQRWVAAGCFESMAHD